MTYTLIDSVTLASSASSVTFSSITQDYRDLVLIVNATGVADYYPAMRFNGDSTNTYSFIYATGTGSSTSSGRATTANAAILSAAIYGFYAHPFFSTASIMDYTATDKHKTYLARSNQVTGGAGYGVEMVSGRWPQTAAITSLEITNGGGSNYAAGSTFYLYGIEA